MVCCEGVKMCSVGIHNSGKGVCVKCEGVCDAHVEKGRLHPLSKCALMLHHVTPCYIMLPHVTSCYLMLHHVTSSITTAALKASIKQNVSSCEFDQLHKIQHLIVILVTAVCRQCVVIPSPLTPAHTTPSPSHPLPHTQLLY